jgi:hypothetical protein
MDTDRLVEVAPHYAVMLILALLVPVVVRNVIGRPDFWIELVLIFVVVFAYRPVVMRLGIGPAAWERGS